MVAAMAKEAIIVKAVGIKEVATVSRIIILFLTTKLKIYYY